jgi:hypothetical protein
VSAQEVGFASVLRNAALFSRPTESPENWFEDFGTSKIIRGHGRIVLDPVFAETVNTTLDYHVFLTPRGECRGLYVAAKRPNGFEVRELGNGRGTVEFDYRTVAKRKGFEQPRLAAIVIGGDGRFRREFVQHHSKRKDVGACVRASSAKLLWRYISRSTDDLPLSHIHRLRAIPIFIGAGADGYSDVKYF